MEAQGVTIAHNMTFGLGESDEGSDEENLGIHYLGNVKASKEGYRDTCCCQFSLNSLPPPDLRQAPMQVASLAALGLVLRS